LYTDLRRVYQWIGGDRPSDVGQAARTRETDGLTAAKMNATPELKRIDSPAAIRGSVARLAEVRNPVGDDAAFITGAAIPADGGRQTA
jgi:galactonate dehydratase